MIRNEKDIATGSATIDNEIKTDVKEKFAQLSKRTSMQVEKLYQEFLLQEGRQGRVTRAYESDANFRNEFIEIRNGRDYVKLIKKYGVDFTVQSDQAEKLAKAWGASTTQAKKIKEILKQIEKELRELEQEVERLNK